MPARKGSKQLVQKQALLGKFQRNNKVIKEMETKVDSQFEKIHFLEKQVKVNSPVVWDLYPEKNHIELKFCLMIQLHM